MGSLILAICANTFMIFSMKFSEKAGADRNNIIFLNYVFGSALAFILGGGLQGGIALSRQAAVPIGLAAFNSLLMVACMLSQQVSISRNGAGITTTYNRLGVLIPTVLSIFMFHEYPTALKIAGILLSAAAIIFSYEKSGAGVAAAAPGTGAETVAGQFGAGQPEMTGGHDSGKRYGLLFAVLIVGGLIDFNSKILGVIAAPEMKSMYSFSTFLFSAVIMAVIALRRPGRITKKDLRYGALIGLPNACITFGMVSAAAALPAYIVFPVYSGAVILLVNGIGAACFKERLTRREIIATAMIAAALVMLNI